MKGILRLYILENNELCTSALNSLSILCENELSHLYVLEVINVKNNQEKIREDGIKIVPTLLRIAPLPMIKIFGDIGNRNEVQYLLEMLLDDNPAILENNINANVTEASL